MNLFRVNLNNLTPTTCWTSSTLAQRPWTVLGRCAIGPAEKAACGLAVKAFASLGETWLVYLGLICPQSKMLPTCRVACQSSEMLCFILARPLSDPPSKKQLVGGVENVRAGAPYPLIQPVVGSLCGHTMSECYVVEGQCVFISKCMYIGA